MAQIKNLAGPGHLTNAVANIPAGLGTAGASPVANTYNIVRHIHIFNRDTSARTVQLFLGATGGSTTSTALMFDQSISPNSGVDLYGMWKMTTAEFLSGLASVTNVVTITVTGEAHAI